MDAFEKKFDLKSRSNIFSIYPIGDTHIGAINFDKERLQKVIKIILADKNQKVVFLLGDLCDAVVLNDTKRFTSANLSDEVLTGSPKMIRSNIANIAVNQTKQVVKLLMPIKEFILGAVKGNHEATVEKTCGIDIHSIICDELGIRNCGDVGIACLNLCRQRRAKIIKVAFMHNASGGRTAGASHNSLARAMNIFDTNIVFQGHTHSPAVQRIVKIGTLNNKTDGPKITRDEQCGVNVGSFLTAFKEGCDDYAQYHLFNPREEIHYRVSVKIIEDRTKKHPSPPRFSISVEELHI